MLLTFYESEVATPIELVMLIHHQIPSPQPNLPPSAHSPHPNRPCDISLTTSTCHLHPNAILSDRLLFTARDASEAFEACHHSIEAREMLRTFLIGNFLDVSVML